MDDEKLILSKKIQIFEDFYNRCKNENKIDEILLKEYLYDVLTWIEVCIKTIDINKLSKIEQKKIRGIKFANNQKKHSIYLYKFNANFYSSFPSNELFPSNNNFPSKFDILWNELKLDDKKYKNQFINYNKYLKDKNILECFKDILEIIEK